MDSAPQNQRTRNGSLGVFLITVLFATTVFAETTTRLETLTVTASRVEHPVSELSYNAAWLNEQQLKDINSTHIHEAMSRIPGAWISRGNGQEHLTAIRSPVLTGAGSCGAFLMLEDGIPLRSSGFCNVNELFESGTEYAGRIEVIRGPGTPVYGSNAMHGLINVISAPFPEETRSGLSLEMGANDYARIAFNRRSKSLQADINLTHDGGYKDDSGFDQQKLKLQLRHGSDDMPMITRIAYSNLNQETAGFVVGSKAYEQANLKRDNPNPEAFRDARSLKVHTRISFSPEPGQQVVLTPYLRHTSMSFLQHFLPGQPLEENGQTGLGLMSLWNLPLSDRLEMISGLDLEYTDAWLEESQAQNNELPSAFLRAVIPAGDHYDYEVTATIASGFTQFTWEATDRLQLSAGFRLDYIDYDYNNLMADGRAKADGSLCGFGGCRFNRPADRTDSFTRVSPRIGMVFDVAATHQLYGSLVRGFRAPQAAELYRLQNNQSVSRIDPESLDSIELGFRGDFDGLTWDLSLYGMRKDNVIFVDADRNNVDNGKTDHAGIEWLVSAQLSESLGLAWNGSYARHRYAAHQLVDGGDIKGNDVDTAPETMGSLQLTWQLPGDVRAELEWVHMGSYYQDPQNTADYEGHNLLNLRVNMSLSKDWRAQLRLLNVTNRDYADRADFAFGDDRYFVGMPFTAYLSVEGTF